VLSLGTSAALVASLVATVAASAAFASVPIVGSAGNVPIGGTSAANVSFTFTEQAVNSILLSTTSGSFTVTICDAAGVTVPLTPAASPVCTVPGTVSFSGTPSVVGSTGSLGASASLIAPNVLQISIAGSDTANIESILISGLKISASSGAAAGAISATVGAFGGSLVAGPTIFSGGNTASGYLVNPITAGSTDAIVAVVSTSCLFSSAGTLAFATSPESVALTTAGLLGTPAAGQQDLTIGATGNYHGANELVTEATACGASYSLASVGSVVTALTYTSAGNTTVYPGENNSPASNLVLVEPSAAFLAAASTFTYTILTPGVVFSTAPTLSYSDPTLSLSAAVISAARTSATVTVNTASTVAATITLTNILYDVASTVPAGTFVSVGVTTSAAQAVLSATNTNAVVFRGIAASAPSPTVYIGQNNQTAGLVTFTESQAGFFQAGVGTGTNVIEICPQGVDYTFTTAPVAMVMGGMAAGNLVLRDGSAASTTNIVTGLQDTTVGKTGCYYWYVWTASTTPSTIVIGAQPSAATGPLINVSVAQAPGGVDTNLYVGTSNVNDTLFATVQFATAVYQNQVAVTALSQPSFSAGTTHGAAGNVQIAETGLGQLKAGENICVEVLWNSGDVQNVFLNGLSTADLPVATASGTGLVIGPVTSSEEGCSGTYNSDVPAGYVQSFSFPVYQQTTTGNGQVVISNISYTALTGAVDGPVQLSVWGLGGSPTYVVFHSTVTNAYIGVKAGLSIGAVSALGLRPTSGYSTKSLKVQAKGKYVTWKFTGGAALAGQHVTIWVTTASIPGVWGPWKALTARVADANGIATYWWKSAKAASVSVRAEWMGNAQYGDSLSPARGATWK
jgi:hypothetical protein